MSSDTPNPSEQEFPTSESSAATDESPAVESNDSAEIEEARTVPSPPPDSPRIAESSEPENDAPAVQESSESDAIPAAERGSSEVREKAPLRERLKQAQQSSQIANAAPSNKSEDAQEATVSPPATSGSKRSVEIPKDDDLDAIMEAEIAEALASGELANDPAPLPMEVDSELEEASDELPPPAVEDELEAGDRLTGTVQSVDGENLFLELGYRSNGLLSVRQFGAKKIPAVGEKLTVRVDRYDAGEGIIFVSLPHGKKKVGGNWDEVQSGQVVECMVNKTNKGGLEVTVGSLQGFMPAGQVDLYYQADLEPYVGQKLQAIVIEVKPSKRKLVVSRKSFLEIERQEQAKTLWQRLEVGQVLPGTVKTLKEYGAFIDIGGADGFLHIGEMSWHHIKHPKEVLKEGQSVEVQIVTLQPEKSRIGLSLKALQKDPWMIAAETYGAGTTVRGKVTRTTKFGAFVEVEKGIEGLIHISELDHKRVGRVTEVVRVDQEVDVQVLSVDPDSRRMSLSLKAMTDAPEPVRDEDLAPSAGQELQRKRKGPLKGGTGGEGGGGLFGDPEQFKS